MSSTNAPATDRQLNYVKDLLHSRVVHPDAAQRLRETLAKGTLSKPAASLAITWLKRQAERPAQVDFGQAIADLEESEMAAKFAAFERHEDEAAENKKILRDVVEFPLTIGIYEVDGKVYKIRKSKTGNLYASVLAWSVRDAERLTASGEKIRARYDYAPGVIRFITQADRVTADRAEELSIVFASCIVCGRTLKAAESVARGIGPVCFGRI